MAEINIINPTSISASFTIATAGKSITAIITRNTGITGIVINIIVPIIETTITIAPIKDMIIITAGRIIDIIIAITTMDTAIRAVDFTLRPQYTNRAGSLA